MKLFSTLGFLTDHSSLINIKWSHHCMQTRIKHTFELNYFEEFTLKSDQFGFKCLTVNNNGLRLFPVQQRVHTFRIKAGVYFNMYVSKVNCLINRYKIILNTIRSYFDCEQNERQPLEVRILEYLENQLVGFQQRDFLHISHGLITAKLFDEEQDVERGQHK